MILLHSESIEAEEDLIGDDLEDEIEGIGQTDADEDPEVLAGLLELSHLCELHAVKNTELELHHGIAGPAEVDGNDLNELEFPDDDALGLSTVPRTRRIDGTVYTVPVPGPAAS